MHVKVGTVRTLCAATMTYNIAGSRTLAGHCSRLVALGAGELRLGGPGGVLEKEAVIAIERRA